MIGTHEPLPAADQLLQGDRLVRGPRGSCSRPTPTSLQTDPKQCTDGLTPTAHQGFRTDADTLRSLGFLQRWGEPKSSKRDGRIADLYRLLSAASRRFPAGPHIARRRNPPIMRGFAALAISIGSLRVRQCLSGNIRLSLPGVQPEGHRPDGNEAGVRRRLRRRVGRLRKPRSAPLGADRGCQPGASSASASSSSCF